MAAAAAAALSPAERSSCIARLLQEGDLLRSRNQPAAALAKYSEVLLLDPAHVGALNLKGTCHRALKDIPAAMHCYQHALSLAPTDWIAHNNAGILAKELGLLDVATQHYECAIKHGPPGCVAVENLSVVKTDMGTKCKLAGATEQAVRLYLEALHLNPAYHPAYFNLGVVESERGDFVRALEYYQMAVARNPNYAEALLNIGVIQKNQGKLELAIEYYSRALRSNANFAIAASNLAIALTDMGTRLKNEGKLDEGVASYKQALVHNSKYPAAWYNLGVAYAEKCRFDDAKVAYELAVLFDPSCAEAHNNLGVLYKDRGNLDMAVHHYSLALQANPAFAQTLNNMAVIFTMLGKLDEAYDFCARAIAANPLYAEAHNNLGVLKRDEGRIEEAILAYSDCLAIDPLSRNAGQNRLLALNSVCRPQVADEETAMAVWQAHHAWGTAFAQQYASARFLHWNNPATLDRPLRIGYLSADFFTHSVSYFIEAPLAHADRTQTFVACYANVARRDKKTALLQSHAHLWRNVHDKSAREVADLVRSDNIDILVELTGHTGGNRLDVMALKPAPLAVSWIGYPNTTGLPGSIIDYRFTDEVVDPVSTTQRYSEQLVRLPTCFLCYTPPQDAPPVAPTPALSRGFITFGSFNNLAKLNDTVLACWCRILLAVPSSRMLLKCKPFASASVVSKTVQRFVEMGIDACRVDCIPLLPSTQEHLQTYAQVDICLDTFPYAGTTTTCEALFCGVPVVTRATGRQAPNCHAHNVGKSLLTRIEGAQALIAHSEAEYIGIATALAQPEHVARLQELRAALRPAMLKSPLCDGPAFVAGLTKVYQQLWRNYCAARKNNTG